MVRLLGVLILIGLFSLVIPSVSGIDLEVEKIAKDRIIVAEIGNPAVFDFVIDNGGDEDNFEIYSLLGVSMSPKGTFKLPSGKKTVEIKVFPNEAILRQRGLYSFEYRLRGQNSGIFRDTLTIEIISIDSALEIRESKFHPDDLIFNISVKNKHKIKLDDVLLNFDSEFFSLSKVESFGPLEVKEIEVVVDKRNIGDLVAGSYIVKVDIEIGEFETEAEGIIKYLEKEGISYLEESEGIIVRKTTISKTNEGNTETEAEIKFRKNILSRLFTSYSVEPLEVKRGGIYVDYIWKKEIGPNESFVVVAKTNRTLPLIFLLIVIFGALAVKFYSKENLVVRKKASLVKTKSGEFALKISIRLRARKHLEDIEVSDRLAGGMRIYNKYGRKPDRVDPEKRKMFWHIGKLNPGEERVFSYIMYSKVKVLGRFEIPSADASYDDNGKNEKSTSNRTFFVS